MASALDARWRQTSSWRIAGDAATVDGPHPFGWRLTTDAVNLDGNTRYVVEVSFDVPARPVDNDAIGVNLYETSMGIGGFACKVSYTQGWGCKVRVNAEVARTSTFGTYPFGVELVADTMTRYHYVDVIIDAP